MVTRARLIRCLAILLLAVMVFYCLALLNRIETAYNPDNLFSFHYVLKQYPDHLVLNRIITR